MLGLVFSLLAALLFGLNSAIVRRGLVLGEVYQSVLVSIAVALPILSILTLVTEELYGIYYINSLGLLYFAIAGITQYVLMRSFIYAAMKRVGANITFPIISSASILSFGFGVIILGERFSLNFLIATVLVTSGVALVALKGTYVKEKHSYRLGIIYAFAAMILHSISSLLVRAGAIATNLPMLGLFISHAFAMIIFLLLLLLPSMRKELRLIFKPQFNEATFLHFLIGGIIVTIGQIFRYLSLWLLPMTMVTPILGSSPLFCIIFSYIYNRNLEEFNIRVIAGTLTVTAGLMLAFI